MSRRPSRLTAAHPDANQAAIVAALRQCGAFVELLSGVGCGCPDLLVGIQGRWHLVEVKDGRQKPSARQLRESQVEWHAVAARHGLPVHVVESVEQAVELVNREVRRGC